MENLSVSDFDLEKSCFSDSSYGFDRIRVIYDSFYSYNLLL